MVTLRQIGLHATRSAVLEVGGFWAPLLACCARAMDVCFVPENVARVIEVVEGAEGLEAWLASLRR